MASGIQTLRFDLGEIARLESKETGPRKTAKYAFIAFGLITLVGISLAAIGHVSFFNALSCNTVVTWSMMGGSFAIGLGGMFSSMGVGALKKLSRDIHKTSITGERLLEAIEYQLKDAHFTDDASPTKKERIQEIKELLRALSPHQRQELLLALCERLKGAEKLEEEIIHYALLPSTLVDSLALITPDMFEFLRDCMTKGQIRRFNNALSQRLETLTQPFERLCFNIDYRVQEGFLIGILSTFCGENFRPMPSAQSIPVHKMPKLIQLAKRALHIVRTHIDLIPETEEMTRFMSLTKRFKLASYEYSHPLLEEEASITSRVAKFKRTKLKGTGEKLLQTIEFKLNDRNYTEIRKQGHITHKKLTVSRETRLGEVQHILNHLNPKQARGILLILEDRFRGTDSMTKSEKKFVDVILEDTLLAANLKANDPLNTLERFIHDDDSGSSDSSGE